MPLISFANVMLFYHDLQDEPIDKSKHWGDLEEEEQEEEMDEEELEDGMEIWNTLSRYCFAFNSEVYLFVYYSLCFLL